MLRDNRLDFRNIGRAPRKRPTNADILADLATVPSRRRNCAKTRRLRQIGVVPRNED
jgi:hypothetical protein